MLNEEWYEQRDRLIEAFGKTGNGAVSLEVVRLAREVVQYDSYRDRIIELFSAAHSIDDRETNEKLAAHLLEDEERSRREAMERGIRQITSALSFLQITGALTAFHMLA